MRIRFLILAAGLIAGCNKSTGPSDPFAGSWTVTLAKFADSTYLSPSPFVMTITNVGASYVAGLPDLVYYTAAGTADGAYGVASDSTLFAITGDTLFLHLGGSVATCSMTMSGIITGTGATGSFGLQNGCGPHTENSTWVATRQ